MREPGGKAAFRSQPEQVRHTDGTAELLKTPVH